MKAKLITLKSRICEMLCPDLKALRIDNQRLRARAKAAYQEGYTDALQAVDQNGIWSAKAQQREDK